eukprot:Seg411.7 transcript_id=Seg411.7/GoldUCD/mRNA.D3Y31 product="hypothetical protein" protein_id=Seg411.7/GoldUCD/D3Y31
MTQPACSIHYESTKTSDNLITASQNTLQTLIECKSIRASLRGENHHVEQCNKIPDTIEESSDFYYHRECYQKFTYAKALMKRKKGKDEEQEASTKVQRTARGTSLNADEARPRGLFPDLCMICQKKTLKVNNKRQPITKIVTKTAERTLKASAHVRDDKDMVVAVAETDLIAKEFQKHEKCYREYTRVVRESASEMEKDQDEVKGNFDAVLSMVDNDVLQGQQCISMETLMNEYEGDLGTKQSRHRLKERLRKHYEEKLVFLQPEYHAPQVVISKECLHGQIFSRNSTFFKEFTVQRAALILRASILEATENVSNVPWPPTVESLGSIDRRCPSILGLFFKTLLSQKDSHNMIGEKVERLVDSFSQDVMHAVSKGKFLTPKHAAVGLGLHSLTGQKLPITILARLGHSISYDTVNEIETAQAELVEHFQSLSLSLPIQPAAEGNKSIGTVLRKEDVSIPKTKRRSVKPSAAEIQPSVKIRSKVSPPSFAGKDISQYRNDSQKLCEKLLLTWKSVRYLNSRNQRNPRFVGWIVHKFQRAHSEATKMTYLPPILTPITEYATIIEMFHVSRQLAKQSNMAYTHITLDVGAAIKAFHVVWNNPHAW